MESLGPRLQSNSSTFPLTHVAARLEELAQGMWPNQQGSDANQPLQEADGRIASCLVQVRGSCRDITELPEQILDDPGRKLMLAFWACVTQRQAESAVPLTAVAELWQQRLCLAEEACQ